MPVLRQCSSVIQSSSDLVCNDNECLRQKCEGSPFHRVVPIPLGTYRDPRVLISVGISGWGGGDNGFVLRPVGIEKLNPPPSLIPH